MDDVRWTDDALRDLDEIGAYLEPRSPSAAERIVRRITEAVSALLFHPYLGRSGRVPGTRELVVTGTPYIAVYRIESGVSIVALFHGAQLWPEQFD